MILTRRFFMAKKIINAVFVALVLIFLSAGLLKTAFFPNDINELENRKANKLPSPSFSAFLDGSYQSSVRDALSDQVFFAESMKELYNRVNSAFVKLSVSSAASSAAMSEVREYIKVDDMNLYGKNYDHILYNPTVFEWVVDMLDVNINGFNNIISALPETDFYLYYVEKETDINFVTGKKSGIFEYLSENINIPSEKEARFEVNDFEEFSKCFYRTDHHWNEEGSYRGYIELLDLLKISDLPIEKGEKIKLSDSFAGSKTQSPGVSSFREDFYAYKLCYPEMTICQNGEKTKDFGMQNEYFEKKADLPPVTYGNFYGGDMGEIIFDTGNTEKDSILVLGESYDNAILKLLASHFDKTYSVDMRFYNAYMGKDFNISEYVKEHSIDRVLFIGNIDFFINEEFIPEY